MKAHQKIIKDNARTILKIAAKYFDCKYSNALYHLWEKHPAFPSFLSLQYIFSRMGKDSFAMHITFEELLNIPVPFIAHITTNVDLFIFVSEVTVKSVVIIDGEGGVETIARKEFEQIWDGNVFLIDNLKGEIDISFKDKFNVLVDQIRCPFFVSCLILLFIYLLILKQEWSFQFLSYLFAVVGGVIASMLLFVEQIDKYNIFIKKLCSANGSKSKVDCSSILDFKDAYFMGLIFWSDIGLVYFMFLLMLLLIFPFTISQIVINICSIFSILYVCYSLYYQRFIAKKWCTLCLSIQAVFVYMFIWAVCTFSFTEIQMVFYVDKIVGITLVALSTLSIYMIVKPLLNTQKKHPFLQNKYNEVVYDENVIKYLFLKEREVTDFCKVCKLTVGNYDAETHLRLIISPICVSCIKELQVLLPILQRKKKLALDLIFLLDRKKHPESLFIAKYLISIYQKNVDRFAVVLQEYVNNYPISKNRILQNRELLQEDTNVEKFINVQEKWCLDHKFYSTPVLFIDKNKFPDYYSVDDIDYLYS